MEKLTKAQKELHDWLVEYIREHQHSPSIRQMMTAMKLKSPAPIQSRLERLRKKKYIDWIDGQARTLKILYPPQIEGVQILGSIAAGGLVEPFTDDQTDKLMLAGLDDSNCYALRVTGDSMIEDFITEGDFAIMEKVVEPERVKNGAIVAARVDGYGTTLKHFHRENDYILLKPANSNYQPIKTNPADVQIQGVLIGVWRAYS